MRTYATAIVLGAALALAGVDAVHAQQGTGQPQPVGTAREGTRTLQPADTVGAGGPPALAPLIRARSEDSPLRVALLHLTADRAALSRRYDIPLSPVLHARVRAFYDGWEAALVRIDTAALNAAGRADLAAMRARIEAGRNTLRAEEREREMVTLLLPDLRTLQQLQERRRERLLPDPMQTAQTLNDVMKNVRRLTALIAADSAFRVGPLRNVPAEAALAAARLMKPASSAGSAMAPGAAAAAAGSAGPGRAGGAGARAGALRVMLDDWFDYHHGYDPLFTWWAKQPYAELQAALDAYVAAIRKRWSPDVVSMS